MSRDMLHFDKLYYAHECYLCDYAHNLASSILYAFAARGIMSSKLLDKAQLEQVASRSKQKKIIMWFLEFDKMYSKTGCFKTLPVLEAQ